MSLILAWFMENFIAAVSDRKAIHKHPDGTVTAAGEHCKKLHPLTPEILLAASGDAELGPTLAKSLASFVQQCRDDSDLFRCLEIAVPFFARHFCASRTYEVPQDSSVLLLGFDAAQQRLRGVGWDRVGDFVPVQMGRPGDIVILGHEEGKRLADDRTNWLSANSPEEALSLLEGVVKDVGSLVPERVNTNTFSYALVPPALKDSPKKTFSNLADGTRAPWDSAAMKAAAVDSSGNLKLKNIGSPTATTFNPLTTSATYVVVPELTLTITTKGNKVFVTFDMPVKQGTTNTLASLAIFMDGVQQSPDVSFLTQSVNGASVVSASWIIAASAASHTLTFVGRVTAR